MLLPTATADNFIGTHLRQPLAIFLDYDGTLAPIVDQPELAFISEETREAIRSLASAYPVALVSGRSNDKLRDFLKIDGLYLAGSHGIHICGPSGESMEGPDPEEMVGSESLAALDVAKGALDAALGDIPGYLTEHNRFCISAHYRMVRPEDHERVAQTVKHVLEAHPSLTLQKGKMVLEVSEQRAVEYATAHPRRPSLSSPMSHTPTFHLCASLPSLHALSSCVRPSPGTRERPSSGCWGCCAQSSEGMAAPMPPLPLLQTRPLATVLLPTAVLPPRLSRCCSQSTWAMTWPTRTLSARSPGTAASASRWRRLR